MQAVQPGPLVPEDMLCAQAWKPSSQHAGEKRGVADPLLALAPYSVSREVPCSVLKCETVLAPLMRPQKFLDTPV